MLYSSHYINPYMVNRWSGEPKVTRCVLYITSSKGSLHGGAIWSDSYLLQTAVKKYHIGLGQKLKQYNVQDDTVKFVPLNYPLVQIDDFGLSATKCPSISGKKFCFYLSPFIAIIGFVCEVWMNLQAENGSTESMLTLVNTLMWSKVRLLT